MLKYIVPMAFFMIIAALMALAIHFSGYKRRKNSCGCGKNIDVGSLKSQSSCGSCASDPSQSCSCEAPAH